MMSMIMMAIMMQKPVVILDKTSMDDILAHLTVCSCMDNIHSHLEKNIVMIWWTYDDEEMMEYIHHHLEWYDDDMMAIYDADADEDLKGHLMGYDGEEPVDEPDARDCCQKNKPEVEKHVDLQREKCKERNM